MGTIGFKWAQIVQPFEFDRLQQMVVLNGAIARLLLACLLGCLVGLEREAKRDDVREQQRVSFSVTATTKVHEELRGTLSTKSAIDKLLIFRDPEED